MFRVEKWSSFFNCVTVFMKSKTWGWCRSRRLPLERVSTKMTSQSGSPSATSQRSRTSWRPQWCSVTRPGSRWRCTSREWRRREETDFRAVVSWDNSQPGSMTLSHPISAVLKFVILCSNWQLCSPLGILMCPSNLFNLAKPHFS